VVIDKKISDKAFNTSYPNICATLIRRIYGTRNPPINFRRFLIVSVRPEQSIRIITRRAIHTTGGKNIEDAAIRKKAVKYCSRKRQNCAHRRAMAAMCIKLALRAPGQAKSRAALIATAVSLSLWEGNTGSEIT
jgi:hypothetical protein